MRRLRALDSFATVKDGSITKFLFFVYKLDSISSRALKTFSVLLPGPSCREMQEANILLSFLRVPLIRNIKTPLNILFLYGNRKINKSFDYSFSNEIKQSPNIYFHKAKNINSYKSIFLKEEWSDISERRGKSLYGSYLFC